MTQEKYWIVLPDRTDGPMVEQKNAYTKPGRDQKLVIGPGGKEILLKEETKGIQWFETEYMARTFCEAYWKKTVELCETALEDTEARLKGLKEDLKQARKNRRRAHNATYKWRKRSLKNEEAEE